MLRFKPPRRSTPKIHLTALIDIVFLLLVFFLLTSSFVDQQGLVIIVPESESRDTDKFPDLVIKIDKDGKLDFNSKIMSLMQLQVLIKHQVDDKPNRAVVIQADRHVEYNDVIQTIDAVRIAGIKNIVLATRHSH